MVAVEGLGKRYRLRHRPSAIATSTLRDAMAGAAAAPVRWLHPARTAKAATEDFWALRDVSFEVARRAKLSASSAATAPASRTLLKILSRITEPTTGRVTLNGRVASLLEVGTGFHPELTGRENIYLERRRSSA